MHKMSFRSIKLYVRKMCDLQLFTSKLFWTRVQKNDVSPMFRGRTLYVQDISGYTSKHFL